MKALRPKEREADIQKTILDGLAAMRVWAMRCNAGAMFGSHKGKAWAVRYGRKGMADILAIAHEEFEGACCEECICSYVHALPIWIEVKRLGEKQTPEQKAFEQEVTAEGHRYLVAHSWEDVTAALAMSK